MSILHKSVFAGIRSNKRIVALALGLLVAATNPARAALIELTFDFSGGFDLSKNGAPAAPSGALVFTVTVDNTTPDIVPFAAGAGRFALTSITTTAAGLGIVNQAVVSPTPLFIETFEAPLGVAIVGTNFNLADIGWNGGPAPSSFMSNIKDLSTLLLPTSVTMTSTFFLGSITLANGDTLAGNAGAGGPDGTFSARLAANRVPDLSSTLTLFVGAMMLMAAGRGWRKN